MPVVERSPAWVAELVDDGLRAEVVFYEELDCLKLVFPRVHADLQISRIWVGFSSASPTVQILLTQTRYGLNGTTYYPLMSVVS